MILRGSILLGRFGSRLVRVSLIGLGCRLPGDKGGGYFTFGEVFYEVLLVHVHYAWLEVGQLLF